MDLLKQTKLLISSKPVMIGNLLNNNGKLSNNLVEKYLIDNQLSKGIYAFWLADNFPIKYNNLNTDVKFKGANNIPVQSNWENNTHNCLYVGKTTDIKQRLQMHLALGTIDWYKNIPKSIKDKVQKQKEDKTYNVEQYYIDNDYILKRNSQCQFRAGFEHLLKKEQGYVNIIELMKKYVIITFIPVDDVANRFYLEDYAIGYYKSWFNLDSER